ncbi:MFS transporter [Nakamurella deserti]|uniref:MFS transporter n=1 Tax=Nakamurella deserti TaxID=2164074 RepID=UPI000DBEA8A9|nr:MFS transporter [Nakamurella deserti]
MTRALTLLFAVAGGAAVGNLYWAQPLLEEIARSFGVSVGSAGLLVTVTQVGYAVGIFLVVPLGDVLNRRRLIPAVLVASSVALFAASVAPGFALLLVSLVLVGLTTVAGQLLIPLAGDLAEPADRGRIVGTVVSGVLIGILLSRTISGLVADAFGWRAIYVLAGAIALVFAAVLWRALPVLPARERIGYGTLLGSVFAAVRRNRPVPVTLVISSIGFSVFTLFWTAITFLLSDEPYGYSVTEIGLVGLVGLAGAVAAQRAGRLHDRGWSVPVTGAAIAVAIASLVLAAVGQRSIIVILIAVLVLDIAIQAMNVLNQSRMFAVDPEARSRLNTAFVTINFVGGAIGSALASLLWHVGGWTAVMAGGSGLLAVALAVWAVHRRGRLVVPVPSAR